eukprot:m.210865 g.210865  ORF g.210865 m.210865 type:complete len:513 (+) comp39748_c3_seq5:65-1603(+)
MSEGRFKSFKNKGRDQEEMRRRRNAVTVELRKNKRDENLLKRRNVPTDDEEDEASATGSKYKITQNQLDSLAAKIVSSNLAEKLSAVRMARKCLSRTPQAPIDHFIKANIVPELVASLAIDKMPTLQYEACWALTNIASGTSDHTKAVIQCGAVPLLIKLLSCMHRNVASQALWGLGNIIGDSAECRDYVISHGVIRPLLSRITSEIPIEFMRNIAWVISNLCRYSNPAPPFHAVCELLPVISQLILHEDVAVKSDICWAVTYLTDSGNDQIQLVVHSGLVQHIIPLLETDQHKVLMPAIRAIGNIVTGTDEQTQVCIDCGCLPQFGRLLMYPRDSVVRETAWVVSNITAGNESQIQAVIDAGLVPPLISVLRESEYKAQKESAWAVSNFTVGGTAEQVGILIHGGVIPPLCQLLQVRDTQVVQVILDAISTMLKMAGAEAGAVANLIEEAGGLDIIEQLQQHDNVEIYKLAYDIIDTYFSQTGDEDEALVPQATDNNFQFGPGVPQSEFNF